MYYIGRGYDFFNTRKINNFKCGGVVVSKSLFRQGKIMLK